jgi:hypothetical protein
LVEEVFKSSARDIIVNNTCFSSLESMSKCISDFYISYGV